MDIRQLTPDLAVGPQITPQDVSALAEAGFRTLINNRPDAEVPPDLAHHAIQAAAEAAGMTCHYIPFQPGQITPNMVVATVQALQGPLPAVAYCRSGNRSTVLWALSEADRRPGSELAEIAARAGYDLSGVMPVIEALARQPK